MADSLQSLINSLPDTADGIAAYLEGQGIKGLQGLSGVCPLATLMRRNGFQFPKVAADIRNNDMRSLDGVCEVVEHTPATYAFMRRFDVGLFPQLDAMPKGERNG